MNRTLTFAAVLVVAVPLFAAESKTVANPTQAPAQGDSPLVAAAKRTNRLGKKPGYVITNENLVTTGGHFTTTGSQPPVPNPPIPTGEAAPATPTPQTAAADDTARRKKAEEERLRVMKLKAEYEGDTTSDGQDPAQLEGEIRTVKPTPVQEVAPTPVPPSTQQRQPQAQPQPEQQQQEQ